jgi:hypothetical protein
MEWKSLVLVNIARKVVGEQVSPTALDGGSGNTAAYYWCHFLAPSVTQVIIKTSWRIETQCCSSSSITDGGASKFFPI